MQSATQLIRTIQKHQTAILWDMDGVFCDGEPPFASAQYLALAELQKYLDEDVDISSPAFRTKLDALTRGRSTIQICVEMVDEFFDHNNDDNLKADFVKQLNAAINKFNLSEIDALEKQGKYLFTDTVQTFLECAKLRIPMTIVTGSLKIIAEHTRELLAMRMDDEETREFIHSMPTFTPEDYDPASKPEPGPYLMALAHMKKAHGVTDAIVIEDSPSGVQAGVRSGCVTLVRNDLSDAIAAARIKEWVTDHSRISSTIDFETVVPHLVKHHPLHNNIKPNMEGSNVVIVKVL